MTNTTNTKQLEELDQLKDFISRRGYRRCNIAACNCNSYHGGHASDRLTEIASVLRENNLMNGVTILGAIEKLIESAKQHLSAMQSTGNPGKLPEGVMDGAGFADYLYSVIDGCDAPEPDKHKLLIPHIKQRDAQLMAMQSNGWQSGLPQVEFGDLQLSRPLVFETNHDGETWLRLGHYNAIKDRFFESGVNCNGWKTSVTKWFILPLPTAPSDTQTKGDE